MLIQNHFKYREINCTFLNTLQVILTVHMYSFWDMIIFMSQV